MSHELEIINGKANMFYVGSKPWHGLGTELLNPPTIKEAIVYAGLDWDVNLEAVYYSDVSLAGTTYEIIPDARVVRRGTDGKILGVVGTKYEPLQNTEAFAWFDPFVSNGFVELETAGSLAEGKKVWILAKIKSDPLVIKGQDIVEKYILLSNSHDGSMAVSAGYTPIRVVCNNTLSMAQNNSASQLLKVRHTRTMKDTLEKIREIMCITNAAFEATANQYRLLASRDINAKTLEKYVKVVLDQDKLASEITTKGRNQVERVIQLFEYGNGNNMPEIRGTVWAAYNAVTDYISHEASSNLDKRYASLWFGSNARRNKVALEKALELVTQ